MKMKIIKAVILMCLAAILAFVGIGDKNKHILDGPGMVRELKWTSFTISHSSEISNEIFSFTIYNDWDNPSVIGDCRDGEGNEYNIDEPIPISYETIEAIRAMEPEYLSQANNEPFIFEGEEVFMLDGSSVNASIVINGVENKKSASSDFALKIYKLLLPYFKKYK